MNSKFLALAILSIGFESCKPLGDHQQPACASQVCTMEFRTVSVKFLDKSGNQIAVDNYKSANMRTGVLLHDNAISVPGTSQPYYNVVNDSDLAKLSTDGDNVEISGTNPATGQKLTAIIKASGGCSCHIGKVSGPDSVQFN